jgi:hypothetical protein
MRRVKRTRLSGSALTKVLAKASHIIEPNGGNPFDLRGRTPVWRGDTQDVSKVVPGPSGGLAVATGSDNMAIARVFKCTDATLVAASNVIDLRCIYMQPDAAMGSSRWLMAKFNTSEATGRSWLLGTFAAGEPRLQLSDDGTTADVDEFWTEATAPVDGVMYALRVVADGDAGTVVWERHDVATARGGDWTAPTETGSDSFTPITIHDNSAVPFIVGGHSTSSGSGTAFGEMDGFIEFAQWRDGDDGTILATMYPERDTTRLSTTWVDSDSGKTWANTAAVAEQTDWPYSIIGKALDLPNRAANYASTPDAAILDITGDIQLVAHLALDDVDYSTQQVILSKWSSSTQKSYIFAIHNGNMLFTYSTDLTTTGAFKTSTAALPYSDEEDFWVKYTVDVDNGAGDCDITFYHSTDGITWTQLGDVVQLGSTLAIASGTSEVQIGTIYSNTWDLQGEIYSVRLYNGIDGTLAAGFDPSRDADIGDTSFVSTKGETWTVNADAAIFDHSVAVNYIDMPSLSGSFISAQALALTNGFDLRAKLALNDISPTTVNTIMAQWGAGGNAFVWRFETDGEMGLYTDALTKFSSGVSLTDGTTSWVRVTRAGDTVTFYTSTDGSTWTTVGTSTGNSTADLLASTELISVGAYPDGSSFMMGRVFHTLAYDAVGGDLISECNPDLDASAGDASFVASSTNETWTLQGSAAIVSRLVVSSQDNLHVDGTDHLKLSHIPSYDEDTGLWSAVCCIVHAEPLSTFRRVWSTESASGIGARLIWRDGDYRCRLGDGVASAEAIITTTPSVEEKQVIGHIQGTGTINGYSNDDGLIGAAATTGLDAAPVVHGAMTIGARANDNAAQWNGDFYKEILIFNGVELTLKELNILSTQFYGVAV